MGEIEAPSEKISARRSTGPAAGAGAGAEEPILSPIPKPPIFDAVAGAGDGAPPPKISSRSSRDGALEPALEAAEKVLEPRGAEPRDTVSLGAAAPLSPEPSSPSSKAARRLTIIR